MQKLKNVSSLAVRALYVLGITASLTFGFGALQTVQAHHCPNDGYTWLGDCSIGFDDCDFECALAGGYNGTCRVSSDGGPIGCCMCMQ